MEDLSFSIVISTNGRLSFLKAAIESLRYLNYSNFEVCIVCGPEQDGTREFVQAKKGSVKSTFCPQRNLSISRNLGIALAAGDIVAFIDDDAVPEAEWLSDLARSYEDEDVGAVGGVVYDETGINFQARYVTTNRLAYPTTTWSGPVPHLNFPFSPHVPHLLGANCSFRRRVLLELGGFDEEFEYFLDETDLCCRTNDAGYKIVQRPDAFVHHKFAASDLRNAQRIVRRWYPLIKNRVYFGLRNGLLHHSPRDAVAAGLADADSWEASIRHAIPGGHYTPEDLARFTEEAGAAIRDGVLRSEGERALLETNLSQQLGTAFQRYKRLHPVGTRRVICLVTQDYPPDQNGGIARNMSHLALALAQLGHHVHVLTRAKGAASVNFEDGLWIHRLTIDPYPLPAINPIEPLSVPRHIWDYSRTMLAEVRRIHGRRRVDAVYAPLWDCEPIAFVLEGEFPLICALQTTMMFWLESQPLKAEDRDWMAQFGTPIVAIERCILGRATLLQANSHAIVRDIEARYALSLPEDRVVYSAHGMPDWRSPPSSETHRAPNSRTVNCPLRLLFVGRLERRKGIDILLTAATIVLQRFPGVELEIVGDDTIIRSDGRTYREDFERTAVPDSVRRRIAFRGRATERELRGFYRDCDIFVAPSRYESFGLVFVEAMMFGKPVVACKAGGVSEVVVDGETGILINPGSVDQLVGAVTTLINDAPLRAAMGAAGRRVYETRFTDITMRDDLLAMVERVAQTSP